jgi:hypothetical protein
VQVDRVSGQCFDVVITLTVAAKKLAALARLGPR